MAQTSSYVTANARLLRVCVVCGRTQKIQVEIYLFILLKYRAKIRIFGSLDW